MAESTLNLTFTQLKQETAQFLGMTRDETKWGGDSASITALVSSGLRLFYFPPGIGENAPHVWSFLVNAGSEASQSEPGGPEIESCLYSLVLLPEVWEYDLEDDFGGIIGDVTHAYGVAGKVSLINDRQLTNMRSQYATPLPPPAVNGVPRGTVKYAAVCTLQQRSGADFGLIHSQRYRLLVHPVPNADATLQFKYLAIPNALVDGTTIYPLGGAQHAELIKAACTAAAELEFEDRKGPRWDRFMELLRSGIAHDLRIQANRTDAAPWPIAGDSPTLDQAYQDIAVQIGNFMGFGFDPALWTTVQERQVFSIIQSGLRQMNMAHDWKFNKPLQELDVDETATAFDLPDDFGGIIGELTYKPVAA